MSVDILGAIKLHAEGHIAKHRANVDMYLENPVGIGEHSDIVQSVEDELVAIAAWDEKLEIINKYF